MISYKRDGLVTEIELDRRVTKEGIDLLSGVKIGNEIPIVINGFQATQISVNYNRVIRSDAGNATPRLMLSGHCYVNDPAAFLYNYLSTGVNTLSIVCHEGTPALSIVPKRDYKASKYEIPYGELIRSTNRYRESDRYDHKESFNVLVDKATVGFCVYSRGEWRLRLGFEGVKDWTEFKYSDEGWSYHADVGNNLVTLVGMEMDTVERAITKVIEKVTFANYNP